MLEVEESSTTERSASSGTMKSCSLSIGSIGTLSMYSIPWALLLADVNFNEF